MIWLKNVEEFFDYMEWYYEKFLEAYRTRVEKFYSKEYNETPDAFSLMKPILTTSIYRDYNIHSFLSYSDTDKDEFEHFVDGFDSYEEYKEIDNLPDHIKLKRLLEIAKITNYIEHQLSYYGESDNPKPSYYEGAPIYQGNQLADRHFEKISTSTKNELSSKHQNDLNTLDSLPDFILEEILQKVNNDDFSYELSEAIKAYKADLFLASTVTIAVSIETLLKIYIINTLGEKVLPRVYYILNLTEILETNKKIDSRLSHRIKAFNEIRRGVAHSKSGKVEKWDAEQGLTLVKLLVESLF